MRRRTWWIVGLSVLLVASLVGMAFGSYVVLSGGLDRWLEEPHVAEVRVRGTIVLRGQAGVLTGEVASAENIVEQLDRARENPNAKAVLLRVDSPGGGVNAAREIWEAVRRVQAAGKPVVAFFEDTAASGGYYVSAPADRIVAMPDTITGSIGVIAVIPDLSGLYEKLGIRYQVVKSGEFKDMLSGDRPMTPEERAIVEQLIREAYDEFVQVVAEGREMPPERVRELADGRIYTGRQALQVGLVDELGGYRDAVARAGELAGLGARPTVRVYSTPPSFWEFLSGTTTSLLFGHERGPVVALPTGPIELRYELGW
ncbi:MAG: signal peptide peptidase SppA [Thermomicrobium sp.]|nr:signal peptide peptidase SppA [Thermomicrobium sp.]MDW8058476.1 signal peptide peptidase SppA [Thermomicrobium sp.]